MRRTISLLVVLAVSTSTFGQDAQPARPPDIAVRGAFFALNVTDLEASVNWYAAKLGLAVTMRAAKGDAPAVAVLEGGGLIVELVEQVGGARSGPSGSSPGHFKAGVIVGDLDDVMKLLKARGVDIAFGPFPARAGQRANVIIRDNAGNLIQLFGE